MNEETSDPVQPRWWTREVRKVALIWTIAFVLGITGGAFILGAWRGYVFYTDLVRTRDQNAVMWQFVAPIMQQQTQQQRQKTAPQSSTEEKK